MCSTRAQTSFRATGKFQSAVANRSPATTTVDAPTVMSNFLDAVPAGAQDNANDRESGMCTPVGEEGRLIPRANLNDLSEEERQAQMALALMIDQKRNFCKTIMAMRVFCIAIFLFLELALLPNTGMIQFKSYKTGWTNFSTIEEQCGYNSNWIWSAERTSGNYFNPTVDHNLCMRNYASWACMLISRSSAAMMYVVFSLVLLSRMRFCITKLETLPYAELLPFHKMTDLHILGGKTVLVDSYIHTLFHLIRFLLNGDLGWFYSPVAISGYYALIIMGLLCSVWWKTTDCTVATVLTWVWKRCTSAFAYCTTGKHQLTWEVQWNIHMLWATFPIAMIWHRPRFAVYWTVMFALIALDRFCERYYLTTKIEDAEVRAGENGTILRFLLPKYLRNNKATSTANVEVASAIVHICVPKLAVSQYHPFSCFYDPFDPRYGCVYIDRAGDWTGHVHDYAKFHPRIGPMYIAGPMRSEFHSAMQYRNQLLVCTGTAITPILGMAQYYDPAEKSVTLIWVLREKSLIPLLLPAVNPATRVVIYYTAKDPATKGQLALPETEVCSDNNGYFARPTLSNCNPKTRANVLNAESGQAQSRELHRHSNSHAELFARKTSPASNNADRKICTDPASNTRDSFVGDFEDLEAGTGRTTTVMRHAHARSRDAWCIKGYPNVEVILGRPKDLGQLVKQNITSLDDDPLAENVVAISTGVKPMAEGLEGACTGSSIRCFRVDASFG